MDRTEHVVDLAPVPVMADGKPVTDDHGHVRTTITIYDELLTQEEYEQRHGVPRPDPVIEAKKARHAAALRRLRKRASSRRARRLTARDLDDLMVVLGIHEDAADDDRA